MSEAEKYFDLFTTGLAYLNRVEDVYPEEADAFLAVTLSALRGSAENVQYTRFDCRVAGTQALSVIEQLKAAVQNDRRVLIGFVLSDLFPQSFTFRKGERAGEPGVSLKARLIKVNWAKVDGTAVDLESAA
jgi:hypothetical protein